MNRIRFNQFRQKPHGLSGWLNVALMLVAALVFCAIPVAAIAEENASEAKTAPCKGLKPYNNLDELLYQFYINLDSDCLFDMPVEELEEIWDTKILSYDRAKPGETITHLRAKAGFYDKPYKSEKDAFYIERNTFGLTSFEVRITKEYYEKYATLFPAGDFSKMLPEPTIDVVRGKRYNFRQDMEPILEPKNPGKYIMTGFFLPLAVSR